MDEGKRHVTCLTFRLFITRQFETHAYPVHRSCLRDAEICSLALPEQEWEQHVPPVDLAQASMPTTRPVRLGGHG